MPGGIVFPHGLGQSKGPWFHVTLGWCSCKWEAEFCALPVLAFSRERDKVSVQEGPTMSFFKRELTRRQMKAENRRWLFVPYDQLTDQVGPLSREVKGSKGVKSALDSWEAGLP
jgi:hypothetical protein